MKKPVLIIIAGPNGSGKASITSKILQHEWVESCLKEGINSHIQRDLIFTDLRIFNEDTATAIKEAQEGKNIIKHTSQEKLFNDLGL